MNLRSLLLLPGLLVATGLGGCVSPGDVDMGVISRYQRAMAERSPSPRLGPAGLDQLLPAGTVAGPALTVEPIDVREKIETINSYKVIGAEAGRKRIETTTATKVYVRDQATGQLVHDPARDRQMTGLILADQVPEDTTSVEFVRYGAGSGARALLPDSKEMIHLSLEETVLRALANNLDIRVLSFDPAISREEMVRAAAVFDYVVFGSVGKLRNDSQTASTASGAESITNQKNWSVGVRNTTVTGANWQLEWTMARTMDSSRFNLLDTSYEPTVVLQVTQPLLRDAWPEFNLARLRVARLNNQITEQAFRDKVEGIITQVIDTYWLLAQARRSHEILLDLLTQTRQTYETVKGRGGFDAAQVVIKQAEASVRIRQASLINSYRNVLDVQDQLARLLADPQINVLNRYEMSPDTKMVDGKVHYDENEQLLTALRYNPVLAQARLAIAAAAINVTVAKNQALPRLDLTASTGLQGLAGNPRQAHENLFGGDYASYSIALAMEYPLGNRDRAANLRQRQLEHLKSIVTMQNLADQLAVAIRQTVRKIGLSHEAMLAQRAAVEASRQQLQGLLARWELINKTPEFTRTLLQAQETLAGAAQDELGAMVDYNQAMADLAQVTGTVLELHNVEISMPAVLQGTWRPVGPTTMPATPPAAPLPAEGPATAPATLPAGPPALGPMTPPPAPTVPIPGSGPAVPLISPEVLPTQPTTAPAQ